VRSLAGTREEISKETEEGAKDWAGVTEEFYYAGENEGRDEGAECGRGVKNDGGYWETWYTTWSFGDEQGSKVLGREEHSRADRG